MTPDLRTVWAEVTRMKQDIALRPIRVPSGTQPQYVHILRMGRGNEIATYGSTTYYGLKFPTSNVTSVPTFAPSLVDGDCPDQLSAAYLQDPSGSGESLVWVGNKLWPSPSSPVFTGLQSIIPALTMVLAFQTVLMQIGSSGDYVPVYLPARVT